jgi:hypothetical protein
LSEPPLMPLSTSTHLPLFTSIDHLRRLSISPTLWPPYWTWSRPLRPRTRILPTTRTHNPRHHPRPTDQRLRPTATADG